MAEFASRRQFRGIGAFAIAAAITLTVGLILQTRASAGAQEYVRLVAGTSVAISTPPFIQVGKRYAITWGGGDRRRLTQSRVCVRMAGSRC